MGDQIRLSPKDGEVLGRKAEIPSGEALDALCNCGGIMPSTTVNHPK